MLLYAIYIFSIAFFVSKNEYGEVALSVLCLVITFVLGKIYSKNLAILDRNLFIVGNLFILSSFLLGSCYGFYDKIKLYDKSLHFISGFISVKIGWNILKVTKEALYKGIEQCVPGNRIGDIGHAIQTFVEAEGLSVVRDFIGHGIGSVIHEKPDVPHYGLPGKGARIKEGMVFTIEPMVNIGRYQTKMDNNGWTARTIDGKYSAQYEHTIAITKNGPIILTDQD